MAEQLPTLWIRKTACWRTGEISLLIAAFSGRISHFLDPVRYSFRCFFDLIYSTTFFEEVGAFFSSKCVSGRLHFNWHLTSILPIMVLTGGFVPCLPRIERILHPPMLKHLLYLFYLLLHSYFIYSYFRCLAYRLLEDAFGLVLILVRRSETCDVRCGFRALSITGMTT
ncbi:hypothetical protein RvY_01472 [Ramazzottius varieornatus]|uniref:Uncharacterized protein n=1 Tax=Ramazzottius varieornatus TaxID=947166 RepID=A0A1D1UNJ1_RAMVA|nr:hypothetical protein RvY_01472 [Ramazzottius varieornatus]